MEEKDIETEVINLEEIRKENRPSFLKETISFLRDVVICLIIGLALIHFVIRPIQVKGSSMYPTLKNNAIGVSNLLGYHTSGLKRFDIAIIYLEDKNEYLVKRIIGLPGETVSYHNDTLYINGEEVSEPFLDTEYRHSYEDVFTDNIDEIILADDEYFCLGDNRPHSTDSRFYGPFKKDMIVSKGVMILFPIDQVGPKNW